MAVIVNLSFKAVSIYECWLIFPGLEYLHYGCKPPIVHRDVTSTNILLNEKLEAKLGDFGVSRIFTCEGDKQISSVTDNPGISTNVVGTPGYLDPQ